MLLQPVSGSCIWRYERLKWMSRVSVFPATAGMQRAKCLVLRPSSEFVNCKRFLHRLVLRCEMSKFIHHDLPLVNGAECSFHQFSAAPFGDTSS